jgi:hypothetical protein
MKDGNFRLFAPNGNRKLPFVCCKQKRKTEVCFPWSANDNSNRRNGNRLLLFWQTCLSMENAKLRFRIIVEDKSYWTDHGNGMPMPTTMMALHDKSNDPRLNFSPESALQHFGLNIMFILTFMDKDMNMKTYTAEYIFF